ALRAGASLRIASSPPPAQSFLLLRRQGRHAELRPLVLFTPKSLLRLPQATARLEELTTGTFRPVLDDPAGAARRDATRLVLCSGKVYYDLQLSPLRASAAHRAIGR